MPSGLAGGEISTSSIVQTAYRRCREWLLPPNYAGRVTLVSVQESDVLSVATIVGSSPLCDLDAHNLAGQSAFHQLNWLL